MKTASYIRPRLQGTFNLVSCLLLCGFFSVSTSIKAADEPLLEESPALPLRQLVETAITYDLYNAKCRGFSTSIYSANLNKLLIRKYSLTIAQVIENVTSQDQFKLKEALNQRVSQKISGLHGCKEAKKSGYLQELQNKYRDLMQWLEEQP